MFQVHFTLSNLLPSNLSLDMTPFREHKLFIYTLILSTREAVSCWLSSLTERKRRNRRKSNILEKSLIGILFSLSQMMRNKAGTFLTEEVSWPSPTIPNGVYYLGRTVCMDCSCRQYHKDFLKSVLSQCFPSGQLACPSDSWNSWGGSHPRLVRLLFFIHILWHFSSVV